ncbi:hypothetical protein HMPREF0044_1419 [Gleimia coleocanis DSM 15436]|uniref:DNA mimic protein DMP19 C-terminal domain-containing protein n=1 Tax=Gleimia coleocanis DSM 15436 TaxID=525245 RepID=C0W1X9_9ACTO|nr:DMP19 family protein [Gleimia coleocanis]EEH63495.1 hypothetical protein HMPREF0044_1419 [Gleimia coleocanis DSM 15436]
MKLTVDEFQTFTNDEKFAVIENLDAWVDRREIITLLSSSDLESLDGRLLGELGRAYNNTADYEVAITIFEAVAEEDRDARWHYRLAFSYSQITDSLSQDCESNAHKVLSLLNTAVELSDSSELIADCIKLLRYSSAQFEDFIESHKEKYPSIAESYFASTDTQGDNEPLGFSKKIKQVKFSVEDVENADSSWAIIDPMWCEINIYDGHEEYLNTAQRFTLEQRYLLAMTWYFAEVNNGGHDQFFYNSAGVVWQDTLNGFKHFGMFDYAGNFQKVIDYCGGAIPFDRQERFDSLEAIRKENEETYLALLDEADDFIFEYDGADDELHYIQANPEKFIFEGEYFGY